MTENIFWSLYGIFCSKSDHGYCIACGTSKVSHDTWLSLNHFFQTCRSLNMTLFFSIHCVFVLYIFFLKFPLTTIFCSQRMNMAATMLQKCLGNGCQVLIQYLIHEIIANVLRLYVNIFLRKHAMKWCVFLSLPFVYSPILCHLSETMWWILKSKCHIFARATAVKGTTLFP